MSMKWSRASDRPREDPPNARPESDPEYMDANEDLAGAGTGDALLSRLAVIADQPLPDRADALAQLHDELRTRLEAGDTPRVSA